MAMPIQPMEKRPCSAEIGIGLNSPKSLRLSVNATPTMMANPTACIDSMSGQPVNPATIHWE